MFAVCTLLIGAALLDTGSTFSSGASKDICWTMYPVHSEISAETGPCPIVISVSPDVYSPGETITITVEDSRNQTFKGLMVGAHRQTGNTEEIVGEFVSFPADKVQVFTCFGGYRNMITHRNNNKVKAVSVLWRAPSVNVGNITFRATVVQDYSVFWYGVEAQLFTSNKNPKSIVPSKYQVLPTNPMIKGINFLTCGDIKGCFLYPHYCKGDDCVAAVTYQYRPRTDDFKIEMFSSAADNYVSLGFSKDKYMGHDETFTCVSQNSIMSIQHGHNPGPYSERLLTMYISEMEVQHVDGHLQCRFIIPRESFVQKVIQNSSSLKYNTIVYDHAEEWYLQLAWGKTMPDSDVISIHQDKPAQTDARVDLKKNVIHRGSSYHGLVKAHAAVMIIAWIFIGGVVTIMPRHYKYWLPKTQVCGTKVWFQIHKNLAMIMVLLTTTGLACIFAHYGSGIRKIATSHAYVGLTVTAGLGVQACAGLLRPNHGHKLRIFFNWGHHILGQITHILAAVTMFLAFNIEYMTKDMRIFGITSLGVWVALQLIWLVGFEIVQYYRLCRRNIIQVSDKNCLTEEKEDTESICKSKSLMLVFYIISLAVLCVSTLLAILLF